MRYSGWFSAIVCTALVLGPAYVRAADLKVNSKIGSVVVFPQGAQVTRDFTVEVPQGTHSIVLEGLPHELQRRSLRIEAQGPAGLEIGPLDHKVETVPFEKLQHHALKVELETRLAVLRDQRRLAQAEIDAGALQKKLLEEMALLPSRQIGDGKGADAAGLPGLYSTLYGLMGDKFVAAEQRIVDGEVKRRQLDKEIATVKRQLAEQPRGRKKMSRVVVQVTAATSGAARFKLSYQIHGAGWRPVYDARLQTKEGQVALSLVRRAVIFQRTSEDWNEVRLRLSTTKPSGRSQAPDLYPFKVDFRHRPHPVPMASGEVLDLAENQAMDESGRLQRKIYARSKKPGLIAEKSVAAKPRAARVAFGAYQMVFDVPDVTSVNRDGAEKNVMLDMLAFAPKVRLHTTPKRDQRAYLHARFDNKTEAALLPGRLALFRDGVYVGNSALKAVEPGQSADIGFGVDPKVKVRWVRLDRVKGETGLITSSNSDVHRYKITVTNGHKVKMPVRVLDQMPFSEQETLSVSLLKASPKPLMNVEDKRGVMAWDLAAEPGKPLVVEFSYQLVWPKGKAITLH